MIIKETVVLGGRTFTRTYSDANKMIHKIGTDELYSEAYDVLNFEYEETDLEIESEPEG
jgi:hypothetical protein